MYFLFPVFPKIAIRDAFNLIMNIARLFAFPFMITCNYQCRI